MRQSRKHVARIATAAVLAAILSLAGCQGGGGSGGGEPRTGNTSATNGVLAKASTVTVTYYYLPG